MFILLVEDHPVVARVEMEELKADGHEIKWAKSAEEGLEFLVETIPDLMLVDIGLPGMDGREFARAVRRLSRFETTPMLALTSHDTDLDRQLSLEAGFTAHCVKPMDFGGLAKYDPNSTKTLLQSPATL